MVRSDPPHSTLLVVVLRIVLLAYYFPPSPAVGGLRAAKVARAMTDAGHDVHVITAKLPGTTAAARPVWRGLTVEEVQPWTNPRFWYIAAKARLRNSTEPSRSSVPPEGKGVSSARRPVTAWKRYVSSLLWLPDDKQGFIPPAVRAARRAMRGGVDLLYTTVPPFSAALAGLILKRLTGTRWALEFRDPWSDSHFRPEAVRSRLSTAANRWLERSCLQAADHIVSVSEGINRGLIGKINEVGDSKFIVVLNGIEQLPNAALSRGPDVKIRIVHVGSVYHRRDPTPFLRALASLRTELALGPDKISVEFVGQCHEFDGISLKTLCADLGIADIVQFIPWVPRSEAQRLIADADLLLLLAQDQANQIPNKLYDYLGTGVRVLAFADQDGETAAMLRKAGRHLIVADNGVETTREALTTAIQSRSRGEGIDSSVLADWTTERQMSRLVKVLTGRLGRSSAADT